MIQIVPVSEEIPRLVLVKIRCPLVFENELRGNLLSPGFVILDSLDLIKGKVPAVFAFVIAGTLRNTALRDIASCALRILLRQVGDPFSAARFKPRGKRVPHAPHSVRIGKRVIIVRLPRTVRRLLLLRFRLLIEHQRMLRRTVDFFQQLFNLFSVHDLLPQKLSH